MSAPKALGVALVGTAILGVVVSLRYLVHAYLLRDTGRGRCSPLTTSREGLYLNL